MGYSTQLELKNELQLHSYLHETGTFSSFIIAAFEMTNTITCREGKQLVPVIFGGGELYNIYIYIYTQKYKQM